MGHKKIFTKVMSVVLTMVMIITMIPSMAMTAKAEGKALTLYFKLPTGTVAGDWAINYWQTGAATVTDSGDEVRIGGTWNNQMKPALKAAEEDGWGYVTLNITGTLEDFQFVKWIQDAADTTTEPTAYNCWNETITIDELTKAYFILDDTGSNGQWYKDSEGAEKLREPEPVEPVTYTLYFRLRAGTALSDWGVNAWGTQVTIHGNAKQTVSPTEWKDGNFQTLLPVEGKDDWGCVTIEAASLKGLQLVNQAAVKYVEGLAPEIMNGTWTTAYCAENTWYENYEDVPAASTVKSPVINDDGSVTFNFKISEEMLAGEKLYLMGGVPGASWEKGLEMKDEDGDGVYSVKVSNVMPGKYQYKFKYGSNWKTDPSNVKQESDNSLLEVPGFLINAENPAGVGSFDVSAEVPDGISTISIDPSSIQWYVKDEQGEAVTGISVEGDSTDKTKAVITTTKDAKTGYFLVGANYKDGDKDKSAEVKLYYTEKAVLYEYKYKEGSDWVGQSDIYTWYNSKAGNVGAKFREINGKNTAYITLDDTTKSFGYIVRLLGKWGGASEKDREYGDRTIVVGNVDRYTKVKGGEGIEVPYMLPSAKTEYDNGILFKWRDDDRFYNNTMDELNGATVKVVLQKDGGNSVEKTMTYNAQDELFTYNFTSAEGLGEGTYSFHFVVNGEVVQDQYWNGSIEYKKPELDITTKVSPEAVSYNENPVVSFNIKEKGKNNDVELSSLTANISVLGYDQEVAFSPEAKEGVLCVDRSIKAGTYEVPFTITDKWGNKTEKMVPVKVTDKTTTDTSWDESRIYFLLTDRFMDGDTSNNTNCDKTMIEAYHGGDFKGLTSKLDYLKELGINTIWITPIVDNVDIIKNEALHQQAYHGYWAKDFTTIDEHLGDTTDLDNLIDEAQKRGIKLMVDIVVNHAGYGTNNQENFKNMLRTEDDVVEGDVILGELDKLPDFKTEESKVRKTLIEWQTAWANHTTPNGNRIAYFRVDTVKHVDHETWQDLKTSLSKVNPAFKMIGEYYGASITNTGDYLGNGQMDALLDFDFKSIASNFVNGNIEAAEANLEARNEKLSNGFTMGQFLSSHDENGFLYSLGNDTAKMKVAAALQITAKGMPIIYYGEEINLTGPNKFGDQNNNRYDMQFDDLTEEQQAMLTHYKKLLAARAQYSKVFATGTRTKLAGSNDDGYVVFKRSAGDNVYVALNTTGEAKEVSFDVTEENLVDLYSGNVVEVRDGKVTVTVPANADGGTVILAKGEVVKPAPNPTPGEGSTSGGGSTSGQGSTTETPKTEAPTTEQKTVKVSKITVSGASKTIAAGKKITLTAEVSPADATNKAVTWTSSNTKYATVNSKGVVTTKSKGAGKTVTITATAADGSGVKADYKIKLVKHKVKSIKLKASSKSVKAGKKVTVKASVKTTGKTANKTLKWSSSNTKYATVNSKGVVTTKKAGKGKTVKITAKATDGTGKKATIKIKIKK